MFNSDRKRCQGVTCRSDRSDIFPFVTEVASPIVDQAGLSIGAFPKVPECASLRF
jgi:hypothetical protein